MLSWLCPNQRAFQGHHESMLPSKQACFRGASDSLEPPRGTHESMAPDRVFKLYLDKVSLPWRFLAPVVPTPLLAR